MMKKILLTILFCLVSSWGWATNYCTNGDLVAGWKFDAISGTEVDCTSNANNATGSNDGGAASPTEGVTGKYSLAVSFPNSNHSFMQATAAASINNVPLPVLGAWIKPNSFGGSGVFCTGSSIINKHNTGHGPGLCVNSTGAIVFSINRTGGTSKWTTTSTPVTFTGTWQHVSAFYSFSSTANVPTILYNGVSQPINTVTPSGTQGDDSGNPISIGNDANFASGGKFDGTIDEPFYGNFAASSTDINSIMTCGVDGSQCGSINHGFTRFLK